MKTSICHEFGECGMPQMGSFLVTSLENSPPTKHGLSEQHPFGKTTYYPLVKGSACAKTALVAGRVVITSYANCELQGLLPLVYPIYQVH